MIMPRAKAVISRPVLAWLIPKSAAISGSRPAMRNSLVHIRNIPTASRKTTNGSLVEPDGGESFTRGLSFREWRRALRRVRSTDPNRPDSAPEDRNSAANIRVCPSTTHYSPDRPRPGLRDCTDADQCSDRLRSGVEDH